MMRLVIDGREVSLSAAYSLRFVDGPAGPVPVLYRDGKRVTGAWSVELLAHGKADPGGASANTA